MSRNPPPGWYPDPNDPDLARYWDGGRWTEYTGPRTGRSGPPTAPPPSAPEDEGTAATPGADTATTPGPGTVPPPVGAARPQAIEPPRPLGAIAWWAYVVLAIAIAASAAQIAVSLNYADALQTQIDDRSLSLDEAGDAEDLFGASSLAELPLALIGAIGFLVWFHRAYSNLPGITGQRLRFGRGWSIGAWFVPILNLWRPKQIANDIWRGGDQRAKGNPDWTALPVRTLVHWWWALYLLATVLGVIGGGLLSPDPILSESADRLIPVEDRPSDSELEQERAAAVISAAASAIWVIGGVAAILFVRRASERQDETITAAGRDRSET